ncbi:MAG: hypothetical protein GYB65_14740 [Chloroflexi bacterium]|nr:hypothetical protein [Chloroflexota bacterium]
MHTGNTPTVADRLVRLIHGEAPERVPFVPFILGFCAKDAGYPVSVTYEDAEKSFYTQLHTAEKYGFDGTPLYFYASYGAWEFGGEVKMPQSQWEQATMITQHPAESPEAVEALELPPVGATGSVPLALAFSRYQAEHQLPVIGAPQVGVFTAAGNISGVSKLARWLIKQPETAHTLLRKATDHLVDTVGLWVEHFDPAQVLPFIGEPTASNQIISPQQFETFVLPYQRELHEKILDMGINSIVCHICGDQTANLPHWQQIPFSRDGFPGLLSFDHRVDLQQAIDLFGADNIITGNVEPRMIQDGSPDEVYHLCVEKITIGKTAPRGYVLMSGCEVPVQAPPDNIRAMVQAIEDHGYYR